MKRSEMAFYVWILILLGAGWGVTLPLTKIAVSTGHGYFGLIFWQLVIGAAAMALLSVIRGIGLPLNRKAAFVYLVIALIGTVIPNSASYQAIAHLPAGLVSVFMSLIPMISFPIALGLGLEVFSLRRFLGLLAGLAGILLITHPDASLPDQALLVWIPLALVASFCYAFEGNFVAKWGTAGADAIQVLFGASLIGALITLPLALGTGQFVSPFRPWGDAEWALVAASVVHVVVYAAYVWLVGRAGPMFAVQVSYLVTGFGVFWAMLILNESYSSYFWAALVLILVGVFLVQPRRQETLAPDPVIGENAR